MQSLPTHYQHPHTCASTMSARPPVAAATGRVPYRIAQGTTSPQGSNREGSSTKSLPASSQCASSSEKAGTPAARPGKEFSRPDSADSIQASP